MAGSASRRARRFLIHRKFACQVIRARPTNQPNDCLVRWRNTYAWASGWNFEPWRTTFYPEGLAHTKELAYASRQMTAIEINSTYYGSQKPATFAKWRDEVPDDFVFSLKATRYATNRRVLGEAGESIERFVTSGIAELGKKLGPIVWQFAPTKPFDAQDFEAFLALLPKKIDAHRLRHALDVRHESFAVPEFVKLARKYKARDRAHRLREVSDAARFDWRFCVRAIDAQRVREEDRLRGAGAGAMGRSGTDVGQGRCAR